MMKIGITGGIGSGKTTVCEIFKLLGIPVFHADAEARNLQNNNLQIRDQLKGLLGNNIYTPDGMLDRKMMGEIIFNDQNLLQAVNAIIHPAVRQTFLKWGGVFADAPYLIYEAAILFESGYASDFDLNILILADEKTRIDRVLKRDQLTEEIIRQRIRNQMPDEQKRNLADYIIENNDKILLLPQVLKLDKLIREDGKTR